MYDKGKKPFPGTLAESIMLLVFQRRQEQRLHETRAVLQALLPVGTPEQSEDTISAFKEFRLALYPFERSETRKRIADERRALQSLVQAGPVKIRPVPLPTGRALKKYREREARQVNIARRSL